MYIRLPDCLAPEPTVVPRGYHPQMDDMISVPGLGLKPMAIFQACPRQGKGQRQGQADGTTVGGSGHCTSQTIGTTWGSRQARLLLKMSTPASAFCDDCRSTGPTPKGTPWDDERSVSFSSRLKPVMLCYQRREAAATLCHAMPCHAISASHVLQRQQKTAVQEALNNTSLGILLP